jgi:hypothetical protein
MGHKSAPQRVKAGRVRVKANNDIYIFPLLQSLSVQKAAYGCSWYNRSQSLKKLLQFFIMRSKKPVRMTAGKFYYISLETFADVIIL